MIPSFAGLLTAEHRNPMPLLVYSVALLITCSGCSEDTSIRQYRVAKSDTSRTPGSSSPSRPAAGKDQQMLAAIVPNDDVAWFFKLTGDPELVDKSNEHFRNIVKSVEFDLEGEPSWTLSEGWGTQRFDAGMTYANLIQHEDGLTATVTRLPLASGSSEESWRSYIVSNINRWRNQLSLSQQNWEQIQGELEEFPELSQGPAKAYFVSLVGKDSGAMGTPPFMSRPGGNGSDLITTAAPAVSKDSQNATASGGQKPDGASLTYEAPKNWQELEASGMRQAAFEIGTGDERAEVTVIAAGGSIEANIGIWLGQVSMEATDENKKRILDAAEEVEVNGVAARLYTIDGTTGQSDTTTSILIADIPWRSNESLFVKFKGDPALAKDHRDQFVDFVKSIKWQ